MTAYLLILRNPRRHRVRVGALGAIDFAPGYYCYAGSGGVNPLRRVQRHLRPDKPVRWHIDYLTTGRRRMRPVDAFILPGRDECGLARRLAQDLAVVPGFGASDCRCAGHLFHAPGLVGLSATLRPISG